MIKILKYDNIIGIFLFWIFQFEIGVDKGTINNNIIFRIRIWKFSTFISLGMENKNAKEIRQTIQKPQSNDAFA